MPPGSTRRPAASISSKPFGKPRPRATILPAATPISQRCTSASVTAVAFRITSSKCSPKAHPRSCYKPLPFWHHLKERTMHTKALFCIAALAAAATGAAHAQQLRIASNFPTQHTSSVAMDQFKADVEAATKKELTVDLFPAMQLGGAQENVDQTRSGAIFGTVIGAAFLSRTVPEISALSVPFLFTSREQAFRVVDGKVGKLIAEKLEAKGFHLHGFMELGSRNVSNNKQPIKTLFYFKGLMIRLQLDDIHCATFISLVVKPVAI